MPGTTNPLQRKIGFTQARKALTDVYTSVIDESPVVIERQNSPHVVMMREERLTNMLAEHYPFNTQVSFADNQVSMWLPDLPVHAVGGDLEAATGALEAAALDYAERWEQELKHAPNHAERAGWVTRIELAAANGNLADTLLTQ